MAHEPQALDSFSERVAVFCAGLSVILDRLKRGEPAIEGLGPQSVDAESEHKIQRAFESELGLPRGVDPEVWVGDGPCMPPPHCDVLNGMLETLVPLVRGASWEPVLWRYLLPCIPCVIPSHLVDELIARDIEVVLLGHFPLRDADLWKLVDVDEALLTLAVRRYANPEYDCGAFEEVLHAAPEHGWVLRTLIAHAPSDAEKRRVLARYIDQSPERESLLKRADAGLHTEVDKLNS